MHYRDQVGFNESHPHGLFLVFKEVRRQLALSREALARELGVSYATVNWSENGLSRPSKLARAQLDAFCAKMTKQGKLKLSGKDK